MDIRLSITPLQEALWREHPGTGARFLIAPLEGDADAEITHECTDMLGRLDTVLFAQKVAARCCKDWQYIGAGKDPAPCTPENVKLFATKHSQSIMPWFVREARSIEHYRVEALEAAKKD